MGTEVTDRKNPGWRVRAGSAEVLKDFGEREPKKGAGGRC